MTAAKVFPNSIGALTQGPTPKHIYPEIAAAQHDLNAAMKASNLTDFLNKWKR